MANTYAQYFQNAFGDHGKVGYLRAHYDITDYCNKRLDAVGNILNRLRNSLVHAINKQVVLPRGIIMIIENDIMLELNHFEPGISDSLGRILEWLVNQFHRIITGHKEKLPSKA